MLLLISLSLLNIFQAQRVLQACSQGSFWDGQQCISCATPSIGYCECNSYLGCDNLICPNGYLYVPVITGITNTQICVPGCDSSCLSCGIADGSVVCFKCQQGFQLVANLCAPIQNQIPDYPCVSYSTKTALCTTCPSGMFLEFNNAVSYCSPCSSDACATCPSANTCTSCRSGFYLNNTLEASQMCQQCPSNCAVCNWNQICLQCETQYYLDNNGNCQSCQSNFGTQCIACTSLQCTACNYGYYMGSGNVCTQCTITNCLYCNQNQCLACMNGYLLVSQQCVNCQSSLGCSNQQCAINSRNQLICYQCQNGYYLNQYGQCILCSFWNPNVLYCSGAHDSQLFTTLTATQCQQGYNLIVISGVNTCIQNTITNCMSLFNATICSACYPPYVLVNGNCLTCQSPCTSCQGNTISNSLTCTKCNQGYYLQSGICKQCPLNCQVCTSQTECQQCYSGFIYLDQICQSCNQSNCDQCRSNGQCSSCLTGYFTSTSTGACYKCPDGCKTCLYPGQTCQTCQTGYILQQGGCILYQNQQNCLYFNTEIKACQICEYGYYRHKGVCLLCIGYESNFVCRQNIMPSNQVYIQN